MTNLFQIILCLGMFQFVGCKTTEERLPPTAQVLIHASIRYGVVQYLESHDEPKVHAQKIIDIVEKLKTTVVRDQLVEVDKLRIEVNKMIKWDNFEPNQAYLAMFIIDLTSDIIEDRLEEKVLPADQLELVHSIFNSVREGASLFLVD